MKKNEQENLQHKKKLVVIKKENLNEKQPSKQMGKMKGESQKKKYKSLKEKLIKMKHLCSIRSTKFKEKC